jgi:hypothetical protein
VAKVTAKAHVSQELEIGNPSGQTGRREIEGGEQMTDTVNRMDEALSIIDTGLSHLQSREIIAASEVADLLLDLRLLLMQVEAPTTPVLSP